MTRRGWLYVCSGAFVVASLPLAARCVALTRRKPKATGAEVEQQLVQMTNSARQADGLTQFYLHPSLTEVARDYAKKIGSETNYEKPLGDQWKPTEQWIEEEFKVSGYGFPVMRYGVRAGFCRALEGQRLSVSDAFTGWLAEDRGKATPQDRGILNPYFADFGVGVSEAMGVYYLAFVFAKRFRQTNIQDLFAPKDKS